MLNHELNLMENEQKLHDKDTHSLLKVFSAITGIKMRVNGDHEVVAINPNGEEELVIDILPMKK